MKNNIQTLIIIVSMFISTQTFAQQLIPFQARLTDGAGAAVVDGVYAVNFNIYDTATAGTSLWTETHSTVSVLGGVVNVILGSITPLNDPDNDGDFSDAINFYTTDGDRFIGVIINSGQEMVPRHQLITSFQAVNADHSANASKLGGNTPSYYASNAELQSLKGQISGMISAFSIDCPSGWLLADGTSGTPDLRNRFLRGETTADPAALDFGGNDDAITVAHNHGINPPSTALSLNSNGSHNHLGGIKEYKPKDSTYGALATNSGPVDSYGGGIYGRSQRYTSTEGSHTHSGTVNIASFNSTSVGSSATNANLPKYYEVIYCVKQ